MLRFLKLTSGLVGIVAFVFVTSAKTFSHSGHLSAGRLVSGVNSWVASPVFDSEPPVGMTNYSKQFMSPAGNSWNLISSRVLLTQVTSGNYQIRVTNDIDGQLLREYGRTLKYCNINGVITNGTICLDKTYTSVLITGQELAMQIDQFTTTNRIALYSHEFGHALSLTDTNDLPAGTSVMIQGKKAIGPQTADKDHLKLKWGN
jgi:hypothetical protein